MERIWLKSYPPGVPAIIDASEYPSLVAMIDESFAKFRDRKAFICMDKTITYGELDEMSRAIGAWLQSRGLKPGARVALMMPNVLQYPVAIFAVLRAGYVVVNFNPLYTAREVEHQLKDCGAEAVIVLENFAHTLQDSIARTDVKHVVVASMGDLLGFLKGTIVNLVVRNVKKMVPHYSLPGATAFNDALSAGRGMTMQPVNIGPNDVAFLQYTGGTTGVAKGATLLHRNVVANVIQADAWLQPALSRDPKVEQLFMVAALPLYHIFALTACALLGMRTGAVCLLIPNPRDIKGLIAELAKYPVNYFPAVNTLFNGLLNHPDFGKLDWRNLKSAVGGGMAVQKATADRWVKATGQPIIEGYGLSETSPVLTVNRCDIEAYTGSIGLPVPSTDISIRDDDNHEVPLGEPGELCARGPQVMAGYWNKPDETAMVMTPDGYFRTGDIGVMEPDGLIKIVDRKKDMISVSGFKVFPNEVEAVVAHHPGVLECAVIGVPDEKTGEAVKLFVVRKDPSLTAEDLIKYCHAQLTSYKVPKHVEFRTELPKTNVGKILRRALRDPPAETSKAA
ncbi:MAG TPA: long-chain-fatty-acid--CoA ligase [Xanthobacteraceae bacterium]|nr:long-chain-fatty-acid--CoA ligase [Xanthobacteraceae bacterium]